MVRALLEREHELATLAAAAREAAAGAGSVVLVSGESGIGKSVLVDGIGSVLPAGGRLLIGYCDDLATRRALGPFRDLAGSVGPELTRALQEGGDRNRLLDGLRIELTWPGRSTVLVIEDVHWVDDATLDVLRYLVRRMSSLPAVLVLTYRDEEIGPLQHLLGLISRTERVHRLPLARLSRDAVQQLSAESGLDFHEVYAVTSGNPFFVTELVAAGNAPNLPPTIVDTVIARLRTLDQATQDAVEQLAVIPSTLDRWLVDQLVSGGVATLVTAERHGLLTVTLDRVSLRHELVRRAIADSMPAARRIELNQRVLATLLRRDPVDLSAVVHHAAQAGDTASIARFAPLAAAEAAAAGSHREAAAHLRLALDNRSAYGLAEHADLLDRYAFECYLNEDHEPALAAQAESVEMHRTLGDPRSLGASLRWLSRIQWWSGNRSAAERAGAEAVAVLENAGDGRLLAIAYSNQAQLAVLAERHTEALEYGERAIRLARSASRRYGTSWRSG